MKALVISMIALLISFGISMIITRIIYIKRRKEGNLTRRRRIVTFLIILFFVYVAGAAVYFTRYSHATDHALEYMVSTDTVTVSETDNGYLFDGPGTRDAMVFYPGGQVDEKAYAPLMMRIADGGVDCFLVKMPFHMAFFARNRADDFIDEYSYDNWYIGGHSLGGAMAAIYAAEHTDKLDGLMMLASYSTEKISDDMSVLDITATLDQVLNMEKHDENKVNLPADAIPVSIEGGNHSQFGDYGLQRGDGEATITVDDQMEQVTEAFLGMADS